MIDVSVGSAVPIFIDTFDGSAATFPQVHILDTTGTLITTLNLPYIGNGVYLSNYTFTTSGYFIAAFKFFTDSTYTVEDTTYSQDSESYRVSSSPANVVDVNIGDSAPILISTFDGATGAFPRAYLLDTTGTVVATLNLPHIGNGVYLLNHTFPTLGYFITAFKFFTDSTYTVEDTTYSQSSRVYRVGISPAATQHENRLTIAYSAGVHEILTWTEIDGQIAPSPASCTVTVKTSAGATLWTATSISPNGDGVFRFTNTSTLVANANYYVTVAITINGQVITKIIPFETVG